MYTYIIIASYILLLVGFRLARGAASPNKGACPALTKRARASLCEKNTFLGASYPSQGASFSLPLHSKLPRENIANIFFFIML
nr:hypothetical protein [Fusarium oxysporum]